MKRYRTSLIVVVIAVLMCTLLTGCGDPEKKAAKEAFKAEKERIESQIDERDEAIDNAETLLESKAKALDETIVPALKDAIAQAESNEVKIPSMPSKTEEIKDATETLKGIDITEQINDIKNMSSNLKKSRKQYKMLVAPEESFIVERLGNVSSISNVQAVTEDNDPNGKLNKSGGYTAAVYFANATAKENYGFATGDSIEDGTDCGGCVEVYRTVSEAKSRNEYLGVYDGSIFDSGSHTVYGTIIIRTSCELTASEQKALEAEILSALTYIK